MLHLIKTSFLVVSLTLGATLAGCAETSTRQSTGDYVDDSVITTKVKAAILGDAKLKVFEIHVDTFRNVVQLSGPVESREVASHAVEVTKTIAGVKSVKNDLIVK